MSHLHFLNAEILLKGDGTSIPPFHVTWYVFYEKVITYGPKKATSGIHAISSSEFAYSYIKLRVDKFEQESSLLKT